ncbi:MAG TPA: ABC transporter substrate-binding protein, partial [Anaerolineae bacterium]|nr:ABC transporter substrate-binding protein [Anaerolineae bacterium]
MILTLVLGVAACTAATPAPEAPAEPAEAAVPTEEAAEPAEAAAPTEEAAEAAAPTEEAAEEEAAEAASGESIKIGAMYNVTGGMSSIDAPGLNGMKLAAEEINAAGGVLGRSLEVIAIDGKTDQTTVTNAVSEMIEVNGVVAIGGVKDSSLPPGPGPARRRARAAF